ncbi:MAG: hypothetical protein KF691_06875 [Phycisphaeraceae bacterium]|nr:hypothetical protein [Phycisphaeraceae bacterium]
MESFSPREFLRNRRPERFSDSTEIVESRLDGAILETHLDTLTNRSQENDFARFARRLASLEICPNLLPQTGPTGGGDSKVDSETYPVAEALTEIWHVGNGTVAGNERWAFAFSIKKQWKQKVESDVAKLVATDRGYQKAFFITNQYIRDKSRAEVEDALSRKHGLDVRILDRTWITERVFASKREELAIKELAIESSFRRFTKMGPNDTKRQDALDEIQTRIEKAIQASEFSGVLVDDCLEAAFLARSLEKPRENVEGLLLRANRLATKYGSRHQQLRAAYDDAFTAFWWYEDFDSYLEKYSRYESLVGQSDNVTELENAATLWKGLFSASRAGKLDFDKARVLERQRELLKQLEKISQNSERPSAALLAETHAIGLELPVAEPSNVDALLVRLTAAASKVTGLLGFPVQMLVDIVTELGTPFGDRPAYGELHTALAALVEQRSGEIAAAKLHMKRGLQQAMNGDPRGAIRSLGLGLSRLYKDETREDLMFALYACGRAYEELGLLWAARGSVLTAASIASAGIKGPGDLVPFHVGCYNRLKWIELQLGRLPQLLAWHELDGISRDVLLRKGLPESKLPDGHMDFQAILGILLLRTPIDELPRLSRFPILLGELGLEPASAALLFALGHEADAHKIFGGDAGVGDLKDFFTQWLRQPAASELPSTPCLGESALLRMTTHLLGCELEVQSDNETPCVEITESILATMEAVIATASIQNVVAREPKVLIRVRLSPDGPSPFAMEFSTRESMPYVDVACGTWDAQSTTAEFQIAFKDKLGELIGNLIPRAFLIQEFEETLTKMFRDEKVMDRSLNFATSLNHMGNVFGGARKSRSADWVSPEIPEFPLTRTKSWFDGLDISPVASNETKDFNPKAAFRPKDVTLYSVIHEDLWNKAGWSGIGYIWESSNAAPPMMGLIFRDIASGRQIFAEWIQRWGRVDANDDLRVVIVRGVSTEDPASYRVGIGPKRELGPKGGRGYWVVNSRSHQMHPSSHFNLNEFLGAYHKHGTYLLVPVDGRTGSLSVPETDHGIEKHELVVREAWQIGEHDIDSMLIHPGDKVVIPEHAVNPPVAKLLQQRSLQGKKASGDPDFGSA